jgi:hypothetical protein
MCKLVIDIRKNERHIWAYGFRNFRAANSGNYDLFRFGRRDLLQIEMTPSPRGPIEVDETSSFKNPIKDSGHIFVM